MNGRQQLIEQIRQQSIEKRAQALREAAQRQFSNAPIAGAVLGGGGRKAQCLPLGGVMLSIDFGDGAYNNLFLTESGTLNGQPQYLVLLASEGNSQFFVRISWTGSQWALSQVLAINGTIDGEQDFAFSPTLLSSAWSNGQDIEYVTTPGEEFDCSWRHCFAVSGDLFAATLSLAATWIGIPLTEAPNAYTSAALGMEGLNIFWDEQSLGWIIEGPDEGDLSLLPGGTREQLPIGQFAIFDDLVLAISSSVCTFAPPSPPPPPVPGFIFRVDTTLGDGNASFEILTSGEYTYDYTATWTLVSDPSTTGTETGLTGTSTITFSSGGIYDIEITGLFPAMQPQIKNPPDQTKVTGIIQWGSNPWQSMSDMFRECNNLSLYLATDQPDLSSVTNMSRMFDNATAFNADISGWDTSAVTDMNNMFNGATSFNQDISLWVVSSVTDMSFMFNDATQFNADLSGWVVSSVTSMQRMLAAATSFNQDIGDWVVSDVTDMNNMFGGATAFNSDISGWDVSGVTQMNQMFFNATSFNRDLSGWCVSGILPAPTDFDTGATAWILPRPNWGTCPP
jgi:surface protein